MGAMFQRMVAASLLVLLLVQILPFTVSDPASITDRKDGFALSIKPLQVCDSNTGLGGIFADHQWLSALNIETFCAPAASSYLPAPPRRPAEGHAHRLLRPPRLASSL